MTDKCDNDKGQARFALKRNRTLSAIKLTKPDGMNLTAKQKLQITQHWSDDFDTLYEIGAAIYSYIFTTDPESKRLFEFGSDEIEDWRESKLFQKQSLRFARVLCHVVIYMTCPDTMIPTLWKIGYAHKKYSDRGFRPDHWNIFQVALHKVMTDHIKSRYTEMPQEELTSVMEAWKEVSRFIIHHMKHGFLLDEKTAEQRGCSAQGGLTP